MSTQRLTLSLLLRWAPPMAIAVALSSLLGSCESEQTGYDVAIPLIGPLEFDGTSCENSGDICSTDNDCFDEDGFNVGPCAKTMKALEPITVRVSLSPNSPSYTLGFVDTGGWTGIFTAQQFANGEVLEGSRINMTMDGFSLQGGPVTITVQISSRVGLVAGRPATYEPVTPPSCTFSLDAGSTGQDYADGINTCLTDWISENGAPVEFDMQVTSSAGAASSALAAKSGFVTKQLQDYNVDGDWTMATDSQCDDEFAADVLDAVKEGEGFFEQLTCENLTLTGTGNTDQDLDSIHGYALVWDRCGNASAAILLPTSLPAGPYKVEVLESGAVESGVVPVVFFPSGVNFAESLVGAATGKCLSGTPISAEGAAYAGWHHCGPTPPPPRTGNIEVSTDGFCSVAGGSGASGGSGQ